MIKNLAKILVPLIIIITLFVVVEFFYCKNCKSVPGAISSEKAAQKAIDFINKVALNGQATASLLEAVEENGLYKVQLKIEDQEYESYITKDGKLWFNQATAIPDNIEKGDQTGQLEFPKSDVPKVSLFVMSYCPYGNQAEELMAPVVELLGNKAKIELHYVIYSNYGGGGANYCLDKENKYCSMHGINELNQDIREFCVQKYQKDKFWNFVKEINNNCSLKDVNTCWEGIAKNLGINVEKIKTCQKGEGINIAASELALDGKYGISGSPQLIINNKEFEGTRTSEAFKKAICSAFNSEPQECSKTLESESGSASGGCQ